MTHRIGRQFGNYRLTRFLGRGGFAEVYLGEQIYLKTQAALKVLHLQLADEHVQDFLQEARTIAHLEHPHVVQVLEFGVQEGTPFLVMRYAPHGTLRALHPKGSRLPPETIVAYVKQVASALQYAHERHLIHRDVKPENMLLGSRQDILLGDFGLAVAVQRSSQLEHQKVVGTIPYIAPEQLQGKPCTASDQYALGVVVYEWLCGAHPFTGSPPEIAMQHLTAAPLPLREKVPNLSRAAEQVVFRALSKQPSQRFASITAFASALEEALLPAEASHDEPPLSVRPSHPQGLPYLGRHQLHPLVGRVQEWERLHQLLLEVELRTESSPTDHLPVALATPPPTRPSCMLLLGEAGIGKTRLAEELSREAHRRGWAIVWGRGYAQESGIPYQLWIELLRNALQQGLWPPPEGGVSPPLSSSLAALAALLPEVGDLLPESRETATIAHGQEPLRIWEAALAVLVTMSEYAPLLLVLDDLHWADLSSVELLGYLVRRLAHRRILLLGTCRESDLPSAHPLRSLLATLQQERVLSTVQVPPLTDAEIGRLVGHAPVPCIQHIQRYAAGNPFFAEELARVASAGDAMVDEAASSSSKRPGAVLPQSITALLDLRLNKLSGTCQRLLSRATVLGGVFDLHTFCTMETGGNAFDEDRLLDLLEEALQAGVLTEESNGAQITYRFWHPLLASHLYDRLSAGRRASLHLRTAHVLRQMYQGREEEGAAAITYHLINGGARSSEIVYYAEMAGDRAYALSAYPEAERHYRVVIEQRGTLPEGASVDEGRHCANLLERLGESVRVQGKAEDARNYYVQALEVHHSLYHSASFTDPHYEAQIDALLWVEIGKTWFDTGNYEEAHQHYRHGEQLHHEAGVANGPALASLRLQQSYVLLWSKGDFEAARRTALQALSMFKQVLRHQDRATTTIHYATAIRRTLAGDPVDLGRTHILLAAIAASTGNHTEALDHLNTALAIFEHHDRLREIAIVSGNIGDVYLRKTELSLARAALRHSLSIAERIGEVPIMSVAFANLGIVAARAGDLMEAEDLLRRALVLADQIHDPTNISLIHRYLAVALLDQGKLREARLSLCLALKRARSKGFASCMGSALVALGHAYMAQALMEEEARTQSLDALNGSRSDASTRLLRQAKVSLQRVLTAEGIETETRTEALLTLAQIWLLFDEPEAARQQARDAMEQARQYELTWLLMGAKRLLGSILTAQGQHEQAAGFFEQALQEYRARGMGLEYARTLQQYGMALLRQASLQETSYQQGLSYLREACKYFIECQAAFDIQRTERMLMEHCDTPTGELHEMV